MNGEEQTGLKRGASAMQKVSPVYFKIVLALLILTAAAACGTDANDSDTTGSPTMEEEVGVRVGWQPAGMMRRFYAAQELNLWSENGLDADLSQFSSGPAMFAALQSDSIDIAFMGLGAALTGVSQGIDMRIIAIEQEDAGILGLVPRDDAGITSLEDVNGKSIGTLIGSTAHYGLLRGLDSVGLTQDDVEIVPLDYQAHMPAFERGNVDGLWTFPPLLYLAEGEGGEIVATNEDLDIPSPAVWVARSEWLEAQPEGGVRLIQLLDRANELLEENREAIAENISRSVELEMEIVQRTWDEVTNPTVEEMAEQDFYLSLTGDGLLREVQNASDFLLEQGLIEQTPDFDAIIDPGPLQRYLERQ